MRSPNREFLALITLFLPVRAVADEGEDVLSVRPAWASFTVDGAGEDSSKVTARGGVLELEYERGLNDTFWFRACAGGGAYDGPGGVTWGGTATVGLTYAFDVLRYVPTLGLSAGAFAVSGGGVEGTVKPLVELGIGLDVLESRSWSWGFSARFSTSPSEATVFTLGPRLSWRRGYF